jgi:hypothetical protein
MASPMTTPMDGIDRATLLQLVQALSLPERLIVCLHHADGLTVPEIEEGEEGEIKRRLDRATVKAKSLLRKPKRRAA